MVINSDGKAAREYIDDAKSPVRYFVVAVRDERA